MHKIVLALAAVAAIGVAVPVFSSIPAEARAVFVNKHHNNHFYSRYFGWFRGHHYGWFSHRHR